MTAHIKTALVTGAGQRIGRSIVLALAAEGWNVAVHFHTSRDEAAALCHELKIMGRQSVAVCGDLSNPEDITSIMAQAGQALGPLSCLINNASLFEQDEIGSLDDTSWNSHLDTNLKAPVFLTQEFVRQLPKDALGNIINIIDQRVIKLTPDYISYTLSKAALWAFTQTSAIALAPNIRINAISPGPTLANSRQNETQFRAQCDAMPLGYGSSPDELANAALFILATPAMTGEMITIDGGQHLPSYPSEQKPQPKKNDNLAKPQPLPSTVIAPRTHKIFIHDLLINMFIGVYESEKNSKQNVLFNIDMVVDDPVDSLNDDYLQVVCYETIAKAIQKLTEMEHINLVETLAERVAEICLSNTRVASVIVKIEKLEAVKEATSVGVEIERFRP